MRSRLRAIKFACETLEQRTLFATITWAAGTGDWSDPTNWSPQTVPGPNDNVIIDVPGQNIVVSYTDTTSPLEVNNLQNTELLVIGGGTTASWTGGLWQGSGFVEVAAAIPATMTTPAVPAGTLAISGSADKILKDGQAIDNGGMTTLDGSGNIVGEVGASITNERGATFQVMSAADITFTGGSGDGIFENAGTFIKSGPGITEIGGPQGFTFENSINDTLNETLSLAGDCQITQGTLELGDDQNAALTNGGTYEISAGATLNFDRGQHNIVVLRPPNGAPQVIPSMTGNGTLEVSGGTVQFYGIFNVTELDVSGGAFFLQQNMKELAGTTQQNTSPSPGTTFGLTNILSVTGGTFGGNGGGIFPAPQSDKPVTSEEEPALVVTDSFTWTGGALSGLGRLQIDSSATSSITGTNAKSVDGGFGVDIFGDTIWQGSGTITMNGGSVLFIHSTGTLDDEGDGTIIQGNVDAQGGSIWNMGNLLKSGGTGTTVIGNGIDFINDLNPLNYVTATIPVLQPTKLAMQALEGLDLGGFLLAKLSVRTGTVSMRGTSTNNDDILISAGATLSYDAGTHSNSTYANSNDVADASILGQSGGTLNIGNATFTSDSQSLVDVAQINFGIGSAFFNNTAAGAQIMQNGSFTGGSTGTIGGSGPLEVRGGGTFTWNSGTFSGNNVATSSLLIDSGASLTIAPGDPSVTSGNRSTTNSYSIQNDGAISWTTMPGVLNISGNYTQSSTGTLDVAFGLVSGAPMVDSLSVSGNVAIAGALSLTVGSTTFVNGEPFTIINNAGLNPISGTFNGFVQGATVTIGSTEFIVSYIGGDGNDFVLTALIPPSITIATPDPVVEGNSGTSNLIFTVSLSAPTAQDITVHYTTSSITATSGSDFLPAIGTLTIPAGQITGSIAVAIVGDTVNEPDETFALTLSNPVNGILGTPSSAIGTILNDDGPPVVLLSQSSYTFDENAGVATITVVRTNPGVAVSVDYATTSGTAISGVDFTPVSGTLSFGVGVNLLTFAVPITPEANFGVNKSFNVRLSNARGGSASIGIPNAVVTIVYSNSPLPAISISNVTVTEPINGQVNAVFNVTVSVASASPITVHYATIDGSASAGSDYVEESGTLTFAPNQLAAQIIVPVNSDFVQENTETFTVLLTNPSTGSSLRSANAIGTILNQLVNTAAIDALHPFHYVDARGNHASIVLVGPGEGVVSYLGVPSDDAKQLVLNDTTAQTQLMIRTSGLQTYLVNLVVNGPIKSINGPSLSMQGNLSVAGAIQLLHLNSLLGGNTLTIGAGSGEFTGLSAIFNQVNNSTFTSGMPLRLLKVNSWQDSAGGVDITAPSIGVIRSTGDFHAEVAITGNLGSLLVGKSLNNSSIRVGGNINVVSAGTMSNTTIFAGASDALTTLPTSSAQFSNNISTINRLTVTSKLPGAFGSTLIAAPIIGNMLLGPVSTFNGGDIFGVAGTSIHTVKAKNGKQQVALTGTGLLGNPFSIGDLVIRLTLPST